MVGQPVDYCMHTHGAASDTATVLYAPVCEGEHIEITEFAQRDVRVSLNDCYFHFP